MKIVSSEIFVLADPPPGPDEAVYQLPSPGAWPPRIRELACLRIHTDAGLSGLSEIFSVPAGVAKTVLDGPESFLGRYLVGEDPIPPDRLWKRLYNTVLHSNRRGWQMICIGAVDVALWDILGKALNRPVWQLLGGVEQASHQVQEATKGARSVIPYCTIVSDAWDRETVLRQQIERLEHLKALGFRGMKIEPMRSSRETIVELTSRAREVLGSSGILCIDVGMMWNDTGAALDVLDRVKEHDIYFFETPFPTDSVEAYRRLTSRAPIRIAAGEHTVSRWEFFDLMDHGGLHVVQPYMTTVGGLSEAKRVVEHAEPRGVLVIPGNWSTQILGAASVHFALWSPISPLIEYAPADIYPSPLRREIQRLGIPVVNGSIAPPVAPGMGIELPDDLIRHFRIG
jgi:L-alanine-DL-glutamate epimerase-like enolase superfamily enzyme